VGDLDTRCLTFGYIFQLNGSTIFWQSKKQLLVAMSSIEIEYIVAATAPKELLWLQTLLTKLSYLVTLPSLLYYDNQSCIALTKNFKFHKCSKHIEIKYHFLRKKVESKFIKLKFTTILEMWADIQTKSLPKPKHHACTSAQSLHDYLQFSSLN